MANVTVNFLSNVAATDPLGVGCVITEFGGNPVPIVGNTTWHANLAALAPGHCRFSLGWYGGNPSYAAGGSPGQQGSGGSTATTLINTVKGIGAIPLVSFNGNTTDNNFVPADGGSIVHFFNDNGGQHGGRIQYWGIGNEPDNTGGVGTYEAGSGTGSASATLAAMLAADSTINVGLPAAAYWDTGLLTWAAGRTGIGCLSYHAYDGGNTDGTGFPTDPQMYNHLKNDLPAMKAGILYGVEEVNWNPAYSGQTQFYDWHNTCNIADNCGQALSAGGHMTVYGDSNGALGLMNDGSGGQNQPGSYGTRFPSYWGLGIWTGMNGQFKRWSAHMVSATATFAQGVVTAYACDNGKIVVVNKSTSSQALSIAVTLAGGATSGTYNVWATQYGNPTGAITQTVTGASFSASTISYTIPAGTAVSIDVTAGSAGPATRSFGVLGMPAGNLAAKQSIKAAGATTSMIQAQWSALQPSGPLTALNATAVNALITEYTQCATAGLSPFFEIALHYAPAWILPGGSSPVEEFTDQAGNVFNGATAPSGQQVTNWQWTALGRTYVADFITRLGTALSAYAGATFAVKIGGGYYGELHYPPTAISGGYSGWGYGTSMQTGTGLAAGMVICPNPGYLVMSGTAAQDTQWWNWYMDGLGTWLMWFIGQMRSAGWNCPYYVCHPGYGVRSNQAVQSAGYQQAAGEGEDPVRMIGFYANDPLVFPYCTWMNAGSDGFDPPGADSDLAAWKKVYNAAAAVGKQNRLLGENTGGETNAQMDAIFSGAAYGSPLSATAWALQVGTPAGYQGINWLNYASLVAGGANATLAEYQADITALTGTGTGAVAEHDFAGAAEALSIAGRVGVTLVNDFAEGTAGAALTTVNTAGPGESAFDAVTADAGCTAVFSPGPAQAVTVTAAQGGNTANGILLRVKVLTGAQPATAQTGATATQSGTGGSHQAAITTTTTGSVVYAALCLGAAGPFTAAAGTALSDNYQDTANAQCYAAGRTAAATGTPGAVTVGASAPVGYGGGCALAEILPAGTITEDAASPAAAQNTAGTSVASPSFAPPPGSLLVAMVATDWGNPTTTMTVSGGGLTWTEVVKSNGTTQGYAGIWVAQVPAAGAHGGLSGLFSTGTTAGRASVGWAASMGTLNEVYGRAYVYLTANPAVSDAIVQMHSSGNAACNIQVNAAGYLAIQDAAYSYVYTFPAAFPLNQWIRIEWDVKFTGVAGSNSSVAYYALDSTAPIAQVGIANGNFGTAGCSSADFGWTNAHAGQPALYLDNVGLSALGFLGPAGTAGTEADIAGAADTMTAVPTVALRNNAEGGTNGTTVTTANSGAGSGNAWDLVTITNGAVTFSSAHAAHGALSCAFSTTAGGGTVYAQWAASMGAQVTHYGRAYVYLTANPGNDDNIVQFKGSGSFGGGIMIASSGQLRIQNAGFGEVSGGPIMPTGAWFRLEWQVTAGAAGAASATLNYYSSPDSVTITSTLADTAGAFGSGGRVDAVNYGWTGGNPSQPVMYLDSLGVATTGYLGPDILLGLDAAAAADTLSVTGVQFPAMPDAGGAADVLVVVSSTAFVSFADLAGAAEALASAGTGNTAGAVDAIAVIVSVPLGDLGSAISFSGPPAASTGIAGTDLAAVIEFLTVTQGPYVPVPVTFPLLPASPAFIRSQMPRMHVQNLLTGQWLHRDVQGISSPSVTWNLNQPDTFTCTLAPPRPDMIDASGNPLFLPWRDAVYLEENDVIRWGGLITGGTQAGQQWSISCTGFAGYANGTPYDGPPYTEYNIDAGDAVRYIWAYIQGGVNSNLGLQVDSAKVGTLLGATVSNGASATLTRTIVQTDYIVQYGGGPNAPYTRLYLSGNAQGFSPGMDVSIGGNEDARVVAVISNAQKVQTGEIHVSGALSHHHAAGEQVLQIPTNCLLSRTAAAGQNSIWLGNALGFSAGTTILLKGNKPYTIASVITNASGVPTGQVTLTVNLGERHEAGEYVVQAPTPFQLLWWNTPDLGQEIASIQAEAIFDWREKHTWTSPAKEGVRHQFLFAAPRIGGRRSDLRFAEGENIIAPVQVTQGGTGFADSVIMLGSGSGSSQIRTGASQPFGHLRRVAVYQNQTMTTVARAASVGKRVLAAAEAAIDTPTQVVIINHPNAPFGHFGPGDDILVQLATHWRNTGFWCRITSLTQDPTTNVATLTVARSDSFTYSSQPGLAGTI